MSKKQYRKDKTCLNCRHVVADKFCTNCGQENVDTRKTFHHLFIHFFEDLTHYENAFWRTIRNLLFRPASLTKEYLSGKRLSYLAPVRLYIFISFVTFFLISVLPGKDIKKVLEDKKTKDSITQIERQKKGIVPKKIVSLGEDGGGFSISTYDEEDSISTKKSEKVVAKKDSIIPEDLAIDKIKNDKNIPKELKAKLVEKIEESKNEKDEGFINFGYKDIKALDSIQKFGKEEDKENAFSYWFVKKTLEVKENNSKEEIIEKGIESAKHNFPKVLLIYMPIFAFFLWIFHGKKRWYYFDHGIFTLHYFSFLLLINLIVYILNELLDLFGTNGVANFFQNVISTLGYGWMFYYFFPAHHRFYGETRWVSFFKSITLFWINMFFIIFLLIGFFLYTIINIH
jgi:hypothetical protein